MPLKERVITINTFCIGVERHLYNECCEIKLPVLFYATSSTSEQMGRTNGHLHKLKYPAPSCTLSKRIRNIRIYREYKSRLFPTWLTSDLKADGGFRFETFSQPTRPQLKTTYTLRAIAVDIQTTHQNYYFSSTR